MATITRHPADPARLEQGAKIEDDFRYISEQFPDLLARYPEHWIAVYDRQVVAASDDFDDFFRQVDALPVPRSALATDYLSSIPLKLKTCARLAVH